MSAISRTVIVTGGTKGIGQSVARAFHEAGDTVFVAARSDNGFAAGFAERMRFVRCDVRRPENLEALVEMSVTATGRLDVFVNNAGYSRWAPLDEVDELARLVHESMSLRRPFEPQILADRLGLPVASVRGALGRLEVAGIHMHSIKANCINKICAII